MSAHEERQRIIRECIPKLIRALTKFDTTDPNFALCEQHAWHKIRNHRNLSINSHETRRRIDGLIEKFIIGNYPQHAETFRRFCDELIVHPLCVKHYEVDVQWAIIDFLLNVSYNPAGSIRRNCANIEPINFVEKEDNVPNDVEYWVNLLKEDCIPLDQQKCDLVDSDLSDWSDYDSDTESSQNKTKTCDTIADISPEERYKVALLKLGLNPPQKEPHYKLFDSSASKQWLLDNVQHTWWKENQSSTESRNPSVETNFCQLWNQCVLNTSTTFRKITPTSITTEYCLLREIIWMFQEPTNCKFFTVKNGKITVNDSVSIASVTEIGMKAFLQDFVPYMEKLMELQHFIKNIYNYSSLTSAPYTYECYASGLMQLLNPFLTKLTRIEERIKGQNFGEINTILQLRHEIDKDLKYLDMLYAIHSFSVLDHTKYPVHICTAHLLSGLMHEFRMASCQDAANLAIVLFLSAIKTFCQIIDTWWIEGRLDDWQSEFLVERKTVESEEVELRLYEKCKEQSFFVPQSTSNIIQQDAFLALLREHTMQAGCTLNLLYQINKINELKNSSNFKDTLYESFIDAFSKELEKLQNNTQENINKESTQLEVSSKPTNGRLSNCVKQASSEDFWTFQDEFLMMAFQDLNVTADADRTQHMPNTALNFADFLNDLNKSSNVILPLEEIIVKSFSTILKSRISFANNFVMNLYKNEFEILKHLQNMRRVMLLEASDVMQTFYMQLFKHIESGKVWANPFLLTVQLDDILCARIPNMSSLFCINIISAFKCETTKVIDAVNQLNITYDVNKPLQNIITEKNLSDYNEVFRFLLKVKWGLWALESLQFQRKYKTQPPYAELKMIDLLMRRLEQLRFWILYAMQCIHFYLMTQIVQSMSMKLDEKIMSCTTLSEMKAVHESFIETVCSHCFLKPNMSNMKNGIEQLLNLIYVLRFEWATCVAEIEDEDGESGEYVMSSQIDTIEATYIRCHGYLANILNSEVYSKQNSHLAGLSAAFNSSMPY